MTGLNIAYNKKPRDNIIRQYSINQSIKIFIDLLGFLSLFNLNVKTRQTLTFSSD